MTPITSVEDPRIAPFITMRVRKGSLARSDLPLSTQEKFIVAEGEKGVRALLQFSAEPLAILAEAKYFERLSPELAASGMPVERQYLATGELMGQLVGYKMHQGVMALARAPEATPLEELTFPVLALNALTNAENVGAIIRNGVAFGVRSLLVDTDCASPFLRRSVKVAMGSIFQIEWHESGFLGDAFSTLKGRGATIVGAEATSSSRSIRDYVFPMKSVIVLGSEGHGISPELRETLDVSVTIPIAPSVESLNVAAASAVLLYKLSAVQK